MIIGLKLETWPTSADEGKVSWSPMLFRTTLVSEDSSHVSGKSQKCHASVHCTSFSFSCHVLCYWSGEDESFSSDWQQSRRLFSLACPAALYQSSCFSRSASSSLSRLRSEQSAISPCKAAELNRSEETKKKKKKKRTLFSSGTFFQLGIKAAVFVRMENTMMLQLDH